MENSEALLEKKIEAVKSFLNEFCTLNGIKETSLKEHVKVIARYYDEAVYVTAANDENDIKFGMRGLAETELFGSFLTEREQYPKTIKLLEDGGLL